MARTIVQEFTKGLWEEVPPFRLVLGLCPTLAVTKSVENGIGMGIATAFVLVCSNAMVSALRNFIPSKVRIAAYIIVIATFVTLAELILQAYQYPLYLKLGIFTPLIVVNCIILGRAEAFASKNGIVASLADGLGIGIGYTLALGVLGAIREVLGSGTITVGTLIGGLLSKLGIGSLALWSSGISVVPHSFQPFGFMIEAPGAFVALGLMLCVMNFMGKK